MKTRSNCSEKLRICEERLPKIKITVPSVIGVATSEAESKLREKNLMPEMKEVENSGEEPSRVFHQSPEANAEVAKGSRVVLFVAKKAPLLDIVSAATIVAEVGDLSRFRTPRELMAYVGIVPSEDSTGDKVKRGHGRANSRHVLEADGKIDARFQTGKAPDGHTDMREPARIRAC
jgi:beta-lactam-binding protein with PASTA domain